MSVFSRIWTEYGEILRIFQNQHFIDEIKIIFHKIFESFPLRKYKIIGNMGFKGSFSGLTQFLATESVLKTMKDTFYFVLKAFFILKTFEF